eukprot:tig00021036_g17332.t1
MYWKVTAIEGTGVRASRGAEAGKGRRFSAALGRQGSRRASAASSSFSAVSAQGSRRGGKGAGVPAAIDEDAYRRLCGGWRLVREIKNMGPGFARRLEEGARAARRLPSGARSPSLPRPFFFVFELLLLGGGGRELEPELAVEPEGRRPGPEPEPAGVVPGAGAQAAAPSRSGSFISPARSAPVSLASIREGPQEQPEPPPAPPAARSSSSRSPLPSPRETPPRPGAPPVELPSLQRPRLRSASVVLAALPPLSPTGLDELAAGPGTDSEADPARPRLWPDLPPAAASAARRPLAWRRRFVPNRLVQLDAGAGPANPPRPPPDAAPRGVGTPIVRNRPLLPFPGPLVLASLPSQPLKLGAGPRLAQLQAPAPAEEGAGAGPGSPRSAREGAGLPSAIAMFAIGRPLNPGRPSPRARAAPAASGSGSGSSSAAGSPIAAAASAPASLVGQGQGLVLGLGLQHPVPRPPPPPPPAVAAAAAAASDSLGVHPSLGPLAPHGSRRLSPSSLSQIAESPSPLLV